MSANSPKARKFEALAEETRARARAYMAENEVPESDGVVQYLLESARHYDQRARDIQQRADRRQKART